MPTNQTTQSSQSVPPVSPLVQRNEVRTDLSTIQIPVDKSPVSTLNTPSTEAAPVPAAPIAPIRTSETPIIAPVSPAQPKPIEPIPAPAPQPVVPPAAPEVKPPAPFTSVPTPPVAEPAPVSAAPAPAVNPESLQPLPSATQEIKPTDVDAKRAAFDQQMEALGNSPEKNDPGFFAKILQSSGRLFGSEKHVVTAAKSPVEVAPPAANQPVAETPVLATNESSIPATPVAVEQKIAEAEQPEPQAVAPAAQVLESTPPVPPEPTAQDQQIQS